MFFCHSICHQVFTIALFEFLRLCQGKGPSSSFHQGSWECLLLNDRSLPRIRYHRNRCRSTVGPDQKKRWDARRNAPSLRKSKRHIGWWPCSVIPTKAQRSKDLRNTIQTCPLSVKITYGCWLWTMLNNYFVAIVWLVKLRQTTSFHQFVLVESTPFHSVFLPSFRRR